MPERGRANGDTVLDIVICTFDNAAMLDGLLTCLAAQRPAGGQWSVLVVDNNSPDDTRDVVERHSETGAVPGLRRVEERVQGLTPARLQGVRASTAPWIAFVDDDCILREDWVEQAIAFARSHPDCGGFGGRVVPTYVGEPPTVMGRYGWAFAEQNLGETPLAVDCLVGAGMVVSRAALEESGWPRGPFFADRVGRKLVSGGDVEIALRVAGTGRPLWYTPACELRHVIPARRTTMPYLVRMTRGLGVSYSLAQALTWRGPRRSWMRAASTDLAAGLVPVLKRAGRAPSSVSARHDALLAASYECGRWLGVARVAVLLATGRCEFFGADRPDARRRDARRRHAVRAA